MYGKVGCKINGQKDNLPFSFSSIAIYIPVGPPPTIAIE